MTFDIAGDQTDPDLSNNSLTLTSIPVPQSDLSISQVSTNPSPKVGASDTIVVTVTNNDPSDATGVLANPSVLPQGFSSISRVLSQGTYDASTGIWTIGNLLSGQSETLRTVIIINNNNDYVNTTQVAGDQEDAFPANNTSVLTLNPVTEMDLGIELTVNEMSPIVGNEVIFVLTAINLGSSEGSSIQVSDLLPSGLTFVSSTGTLGTYDDATGIWSLGTLSNGTAASLNITATVLGSGNYTSTATISAIETDTDASNDVSSLTITPIPRADLSITSIISNSTPEVGTNVTFTLTATNFGLSDATGVVTTVQLPIGYTFFQATPSQGGYSTVGTTGTWNIGNLANGQVETMTIEATVNNNKDYDFNASINGTETDPVSGNDLTAHSPVPIPRANLSVFMFPNNPAPTVGDIISFTALAQNQGPSDATGVVVTNILPAGLSFVSATTTTGSYNPVTGKWTIGYFNSGVNEQMTISVRVLGSGPVNNMISITGDQNDQDLSNNNFTSTIFPQANADIGLTIESINQAPFISGNQVEVVVTAFNLGGSDATNVNVPFALPSGLTFVSKTPSAGTYDEVGGNWNIGGLTNGRSETLILTLTAEPTGSYALSGSISATEADAVNANNSASLTLAPTPNADLSVTSTIDDLTPAVSSVVTFTIVATNNGGADATNVEVVDLLPPTGYVYSSNTVTTGSYDNLTGLWTVGAMASGASETLTLEAVVQPVGGDYSNFTHVTATENDWDVSNNTVVLTPNVDGVNFPPTAGDDAQTADEDNLIVINLITNDNSGAGILDPSTIDIDFNTAGNQQSIANEAGTWAVNIGGVLTLTPAQDFCGEAKLPYVIRNSNNLTTNVGIVTATLTCVNDDPITVVNTFSTNEESNVSGQFLSASDTDVESVIVANTTPLVGPANGTVTIFSNGSFIYDPNLDFDGSDTIIVEVCDNGSPAPSICVSDTIVINMIPINDAPIAADDAATTDEDTPFTFDVTTNDSDVDGTIAVGTIDLNKFQPGNQQNVTTGQGSWLANPDGTITFTPNANYNGIALLTYAVSDNNGLQSNIATIIVTVNAVNDPVIIDDDTAITNEDEEVAGDITDAGDSDIDGNLVVTLVPIQAPTNGTLDIAFDGSYTYTPNLHFNGTDLFVIEVCDDGTPTPKTCANDSVEITILPVNDFPVATDDATTTLEDNPITFNVQANDFDIDTDGSIDPATLDINPTLAGIQTSLVTNEGTWTVEASGEITFTPFDHYCGVATATYSINDDVGSTSNIGNLTVTVTCVNDPLILDNENITTKEDTPFSGDLTDLGDSDVDGNLISSTTTVSGPSNGAILINADGTYTYTPGSDFNGTDQVVVNICDDGTPGPVTCLNDTINIIVTPVNDGPITTDDATSTDEDTPVSLDIVSNDSDIDGTVAPATVDLNTGSLGRQSFFYTAEGTWKVDAAGTVNFTPHLNFNGVASITYTVDDNFGAVSAIGNITITVNPINDDPVLVNDFVQTPEETLVTGDITNALDLDVDGNLVVNTTPVSESSNGVFNILADGTFDYTPAVDFNGYDMVILQVCDDGTPLPALCGVDTLIILVTPVSDAPIANDDVNSTLEEVPVLTLVPGNDTDSDGQVLPYTVDLDPTTVGTQSIFTTAEGEWMTNNLGNVRFEPAQDFVGLASVDYIIYDNAGLVSNVATLTITVNPVNDPPVLSNDFITTTEDTPVSGDVLDGTDIDVDGNLSMTVTPVNGPSFGGITANSDGTYTYTPNLNYVGEDMVVFSICDDGTPLPSLCSNDTLFITVTPQNDAPIANIDNNSTDEDVPVSTEVIANDFDVDGYIYSSTVDLDPATPGVQNSFSGANGVWTTNAYGFILFDPTLAL